MPTKYVKKNGAVSVYKYDRSRYYKKVVNKKPPGRKASAKGWIRKNLPNISFENAETVKTVMESLIAAQSTDADLGRDLAEVTNNEPVRAT